MTTTKTEKPINLTDAAAKKAHYLLYASISTPQADQYALRIAVQPGGCSGLRYQLFFDDRHLDGDVRFNVDITENTAPHADETKQEKASSSTPITVVVDRMSIPYLTDATIDFVDTIEKQGFTIDNPNAAGSCACGDSFH